jgi:hypothetical protein
MEIENEQNTIDFEQLMIQATEKVEREQPSKNDHPILMDIDNNEKLTSDDEKHASKATALMRNRKPSVISVVSPEKPKSSKIYNQKKEADPNTQIVATETNEEEPRPHKHMKQDDELWNTYDEEASPPDDRVKTDDDYW